MSVEHNNGDNNSSSNCYNFFSRRVEDLGLRMDWDQSFRLAVRVQASGFGGRRTIVRDQLKKNGK